VPAALIRRFISLLSERKETAADWGHSRVQMPTKFFSFLQKQTSKLMKLKLNLPTFEKIVQATSTTHIPI
jgi:hypothetical protein